MLVAKVYTFGAPSLLLLSQLSNAQLDALAMFIQA